MEQKAIVFDASTLISFAMNGLLEEFKSLKKMFRGKFLITSEVRDEIIDKPITIKKFELEALKLKQLLDAKILEMPYVYGVQASEITQTAEEFLSLANSIFKGNGRNIHLIDSGEASCLALSKILSEKGIKNVVAIDERTTRMLCEKPENLKKLLEKKLHIKINAKKEKYAIFRRFKIIRSSELIYIAYKNGLVRLKGSMVLDALLYALKFKGCAISNHEIEEIKKMND